MHKEVKCTIALGASLAQTGVTLAVSTTCFVFFASVHGLQVHTRTETEVAVGWL
jgi:hypothetical protein